MKTAYATFLMFLVAFVVGDIFYVATLWSDFRPQDVVVHASFACGAFVIVGLNGYFILAGTPISASAYIKLILSFLSQVLVLGFFSTWIIAAWKGYLFDRGSPDALWSNLANLGFLLFLVSLLIALLLWSRRQCKCPTDHSSGTR